MKYLLVPFIALGISSAAFAADYPPCSRTVQDECQSVPVAGHHMMKTSKKAVRHAALHHSASGKMEKSAKS